MPAVLRTRRGQRKRLGRSREGFLDGKRLLGLGREGWRGLLGGTAHLLRRSVSSQLIHDAIYKRPTELIVEVGESFLEALTLCH